MTVRWNDVPPDEWVTLNAKLRGAFAGEGTVAVQSLSTTGTLALTRSPSVVLVDTTAGSVTLTLPAASTVTGYRLEVKKMIAANTLTLDGDGSETIDGATTLAWTTQYQSYSILSTGTAWVIV